MICPAVLNEFERHSERLRASASDRRRACQIRNLVDDRVCTANVSSDDALGKKLPSDRFEGCTHLRTLRLLLKKIDEAGWERSDHQMAFHSAFERCVSRVLYRNEWATQKPQIMAHNGWLKCSSEVMVSTPRRFGKTFRCVPHPIRLRRRHTDVSRPGAASRSSVRVSHLHSDAKWWCFLRLVGRAGSCSSALWSLCGC